MGRFSMTIPETTNFNGKSFKNELRSLALRHPLGFVQFNIELKHFELHDEANTKFSKSRKYQKNQVNFKTAGNRLDQSVVRRCVEHYISTTGMAGLEESNNSLHEVIDFVFLNFMTFGTF